MPQVESIEDADKRLDELAAQGRLNPALLLMMAKAHAAAKESSYTKEETKDVMAHLYFKARPLSCLTLAWAAVLYQSPIGSQGLWTKKLMAHLYIKARLLRRLTLALAAIPC